MKALAKYIVRGHWQAVLVTAICGMLMFTLPPFTTLLNYLAAAAVALVTLQIGIKQGLQVLLVAAVLTVLFYLLFGIQAAAVMIMFLWLPVWLLAVVLQYTGQLDRTLSSAALFGVLLLLGVYGLLGDPVPWWIERLHAIKIVLEQAGLPADVFADDQLVREIAALMTGLVIASLVVGVLGSLLLARWWQSVLVHPGGFQDEYYDLRIGKYFGMLTLLVMLATRVADSAAGEVLAQLAMIMLVPCLLVGLAVIHKVVRQNNYSKAWLAVVYVALAVWPPATLLLAGAGLLDTWVDFRRRLQSRSAGNGQ